MRVENTSDGQKHLYVEGREYVVPGAKLQGSIRTNGYCDIPQGDLVKLGEDPAQAALFKDGGPLVVVTRPPALTNPSGNPEDVKKIEEAAAEARAKHEAAETARLEAEEKAKQEAEAAAKATDQPAVEQASVPDAKADGKGGKAKSAAK